MNFPAFQYSVELEAAVLVDWGEGVEVHVALFEQGERQHGLGRTRRRWKNRNVARGCRWPEVLDLRHCIESGKASVSGMRSGCYLGRYFNTGATSLSN
jgi:hypothetical protein